MSRVSRLVYARPVQGAFCVFDLALMASCALAASDRWSHGNFRFAASFLGVIFFGLAAYCAGHYAATGRYPFARHS